MDLEILKNIGNDKLEKLLQIAAILENGQASTQGSPTLKEGIDQYESNAESNLAPKSVLSIRNTNKSILKYLSPLRPLNTITLNDVEKYVCAIKKNAPRGYKVYVRTLRAMFNKFKEWNYINSNPFAKVKCPKVQRLKEDYLSAEDIMLIVEKVESDLIKNVIVFAFNTGMRLSEIVFLEWSSVNMTKRIITVGSERFITKSKKIRYIPMNETIYNLLLKIKASEKQSKRYVFGKCANMHYTPDFFSKKFKEALKKTGIKTDYCFHSLRHGFASRLAQLGVPIITISKLLGHSNISTTMIYSQVNLDDLRQGIEKL